jgi:hypothetical protein
VGHIPRTVSVQGAKWDLIFLYTKLFVCLFVLSRMSNFSATWRLSPLLVTGLQIQTYA